MSKYDLAALDAWTHHDRFIRQVPPASEPVASKIVHGRSPQLLSWLRRRESKRGMESRVKL